jgi:hypothetical protein
MGPVAAAHQTGVADGVVRGSEGTVAQQGGIRGELVSHGVNAGHIQRLVYRHFGQDAGQGTREQGLAAAWWPHHQDVVDNRPSPFGWRWRGRVSVDLCNGVQYFLPNRAQSQLSNPFLDIPKIKLSFLRPKNCRNIAGMFWLPTQSQIHKLVEN